MPLSYDCKKVFNLLQMKLFITNKDYFEDSFPNSKEIHKRAYNELLSSLASNNIPITLSPNFKDEGFVLLDFKSVKGNVYFYEYSASVS